jgi:UDP-2,3-diacylglucosamine pyrophosphatase LpxH
VIVQIKVSGMEGGHQHHRCEAVVPMKDQTRLVLQSWSGLDCGPLAWTTHGNYQR